MDVVIHHNPDCGTSRNVLRIIEAAGYAPFVVEYLKTGWSEPQLRALFAAAGISAREALRTSKSPAEELGLTAEDVSEKTLIKAMVEHPILVNRPIVVTEKGVKLCRPSGLVLDLLPNWPPAPFEKEDGSLVIDADGNRVAGA
ncbi:MAG: arsenate reductase (glutaredoxin) [Litoreibacter sp.]|nr:arsenate reductase (glutaredoxin) [Litoreibacter sp.]MCY4334240.1 arsenate reductase (glutaredoxin) [Litoreibacter sp.]